MAKKTAILLSLLLSLILFAGCGSTPEGQTDQQVEEQEQGQNSDNTSIGLTSFETTDIYGEQVNATIFQDHTLTLVNVWGTFCGPCLEEMPYLGELQKEYEPQGVNVVGIVIDIQDENLEVISEQQDLAQEIVAETGADYTHLIMSEEMMDSVLSQFDAIPASFFVDSDGNVVSEFYIGSKSKDDWIDVIEENINNN